MVDFCIRYEVWIEIHFACVCSTIQPTPSIWKNMSPLNSFYILCFGYKITTNKVSGGDGIPAELFKILKDNAVKVLH